MATHLSVLAWRIPGTGEPAGLPVYGVRVGHDWSDLAVAAAAGDRRIRQCGFRQKMVILKKKNTCRGSYKSLPCTNCMNLVSCDLFPAYVSYQVFSWRCELGALLGFIIGFNFKLPWLGFGFSMNIVELLGIHILGKISLLEWTYTQTWASLVTQW